MAEIQVKSVGEESAVAKQHATDGELAHEQMLADIPVTQRQVSCAGISTPVLEGGSGRPVVLLHGPSGYGAHWLRVIPDLVSTHSVVAPDLPGHGRSELSGAALDRDRVLSWLGELIEQTCASPPVLVGQLIGGAIAARFAAKHSKQLSRLVLVDTFGLAQFQPTPEFARALHDFVAKPTEQTHGRLWRQCAFDLDSVLREMGDRWQAFEAYNLDRARAPAVRAVLPLLMEQLGAPAISAVDLAQIAVPTALIWGRHDRATPLAIAQAASSRYGWPLYVIENAADDPPIEQPAALLRALRTALAIQEGAP